MYDYIFIDIYECFACRQLQHIRVVPTEVTAFPGITVTDGCVPPNKGTGNQAQAKSALKPSLWPLVLFVL